MDEQQLANQSYERFLQRLEQLSQELTGMIGAVSDIREKMYQLCEQIQSSGVPHTNNNNTSNTPQKDDLTLNASSSFHADYQYLQLILQVTTDKEDAAILKEIGKDFWKLFLKFIMLNGERVRNLLMKAKALSYSKLEPINKAKDFLQRYFAEQQEDQQTQDKTNNPNNHSSSEKQYTSETKNSIASISQLP